MSFDWTFLPLSTSYTQFYNDPALDGVNLNFNLGGYDQNWVGSDVYTNIMANKEVGTLETDGGVYETAGPGIDLWRYSTSFPITDSTVRPKYNAVGGTSAGTSNPPPGLNVYPGVSTYSAWGGSSSYIQSRVYGNQPIVCEIYYSLNESRTNIAQGYTGYSFFGDQGGNSLLGISIPDRPGAHIISYASGIFKVGADMLALTDDDFVFGLKYTGDATSGTASIIKNGVVLNTATYGVRATFVIGDFDATYSDLISFIDPYTTNVNQMEIDCDGGFLDLGTNYPPASSVGLINTLDVKFASMAVADVGLGFGVHDPSSFAYWSPGMYYTVPNTPIPLPPVTDFVAVPVSGESPLSVDFTDLSTNSPTSWAWDFTNDGSTDSTEQNPTYVYPAAGVYSVKLTTTNAFGSDPLVKTDYITVTTPPPPPTPSETIIYDNGSLFLGIKKCDDAEFARISMRGTHNSLPTKLYDNGGFPDRQLVFWPVPSESTKAVELWLWDPLFIQTLDDELNLPPGYERYYIYGLALELCDAFSQEPTQELINSFLEAESAIKTKNQINFMAQPSNAILAMKARNRAYNIIDFYTGANMLPRDER